MEKLGHAGRPMWATVQWASSSLESPGELVYCIKEPVLTATRGKIVTVASEVQTHAPFLLPPPCLPQKSYSPQEKREDNVAEAVHREMERKSERAAMSSPPLELPQVTAIRR